MPVLSLIVSDVCLQVFDQYLNFITLEDDMFILGNQIGRASCRERV